MAKFCVSLEKTSIKSKYNNVSFLVLYIFLKFHLEKYNVLNLDSGQLRR